MHTVVVLSDAFGATYETLPGQFRQVKDPFPVLIGTARFPTWSPAGHSEVLLTSTRAVALGGCSSGWPPNNDNFSRAPERQSNHR
jgi:hypothetical protein